MSTTRPPATMSGVASGHPRRAILHAMKHLLAPLLFLTLIVPGAAGERDMYLERLDFDGQALVTEVVDGDTVVLDNGRQVRLVGIQAPKLPLGRPGFEKWPLADAAKAALEDMVLGQTVSLGYGGLRTDRYNRLLAHLFLPDGEWVQGRLLEDGMARVYSFPDNRALVADMLLREIRARGEQRGIWSVPYYTVLDTAAAAHHIDRFALVEGRVLETARVRGQTYLNFGDDWRTDFTISIAARDWKQFEAGSISHEDYRGRLVRVRGWLRERNGPMINATHPEQIEVLNP